MNLRDPYGEKCREADKRAALERDAERYRFLRDHTGNKIMRKLMGECQPSRWDEVIDQERRSVGKSEQP